MGGSYSNLKRSYDVFRAGSSPNLILAGSSSNLMAGSSSNLKRSNDVFLAGSSSNPERNYHVFLSFRGTDVRDGFLSHLYSGLDRGGIYTFVDSEELRKGEQISPALLKAIENSRVAIMVFSKDYASSTWCLEELATIMECKEQRNLKVFPVFYKVEPREVRTPRKSYREAMAKHEEKFGKDSEKVKRWGKALLDAGSLSGWEYHEGDEAEFIQLIVKELSIHLDRTPLNVAEYPVGIDSRVQELISHKEWGNGDAVMIGLWGTGGVGKTTLAKALYNAIRGQFQGTCFLERVRENSNRNSGLVDLQGKLLSEILAHRSLTVYSVDGGITLIRERLSCKKVLLVLDDVDKLDQLKALAGEGHWFGKGSRIIVTSRDKHMLTSRGINCVYEVKTLDDDEARELFCWHAFRNGMKVKIGRDLIDRALRYAQGLPLALEVLGSFLCGREESVWESALRKLSKDPHPTINAVLKISFDGLEDNERKIFLDIACFFKGKNIGDIKKILGSCDFETAIGIQILMERSLIRNEYGHLQMHDLVQCMGKDIVNQECLDDPGKRSRLWVLEDVLDILYGDTVTDAVKAIVLYSTKAEEITISPHAFTNMKMLRMLILSGVHISSQGPVHLPNKLRWLTWSDAPDLEFGPGRKELVGIDVRGRRIKQLRGSFRNFGLLKFINFRGCKSLTSVPDLSSVPNLESLDLSGCKSLVKVHQSVGDLGKLKILSLELCSKLSIFPNKLKTKSLQKLNLSGCSKLEKFPDILEKMEHLEVLDLCRTAIKELPTSIENLVSVEVMILNYCTNLARLPSSIYKLHSLEYLYLEGCSNFVMFPKNSEHSTDPDGHLGFPNLERLELSGCKLSEVGFLENSSNFPKLKWLYLSENKFTHLPTSINKYHALEWLEVEKCQQLQEIPQLPSNMHTLKANGCKSLQKLPDFSSLSSRWLEFYFSSRCELFRKGAKMAYVSLLEGLPKTSALDISLPGGEMPEWFLPCEDGYTFFMVPKDLYDKYLGLAYCVVLRPEEGKVRAGCEIQTIVNGEILILPDNGGRSLLYYSLLSSEMRFEYWPRCQLHSVDKHLRGDWSKFQVRVGQRCGSLIKCGFCLIFEKQEDARRVVVRNHPLGHCISYRPSTSRARPNTYTYEAISATMATAGTLIPVPTTGT